MKTIKTGKRGRPAKLKAETIMANNLTNRLNLAHEKVELYKENAEAAYRAKHAVLTDANQALNAIDTYVKAMDNALNVYHTNMNLLSKAITEIKQQYTASH